MNSGPSKGRIYVRRPCLGKDGMKSEKLVIIMVGLPARGKTFLSIRLQRYLEWQGRRVKIFNVGSYRRYILGMESSRSDFFDPRSTVFAREREKIAKRCFSDLSEWLEEAGDVAIYDATNVTGARRAFLASECGRLGFDHVFVENICDDPEIIERIVNVKITSSVDYRDVEDLAAARRDFAERVAHYESVYEPVGETSDYIKTFNFGEKIEKGFGFSSGPAARLLDEIARFLGSINLVDKNVYLTRHGQTHFNMEDRIGGDSSLTRHGKEYARRLAAYFNPVEPVIFTSAKVRTIETAAFLDGEKRALPELNEINSGVCDGMTYEEIRDRYPEIHDGRNGDKFNFRYPGGESYRDLIRRVSGAVVEIESQKDDVLVIAHRAVNRCLFSYFIPTVPDEIPYLEMPLNRVIRIRHSKALYRYDIIEI